MAEEDDEPQAKNDPPAPLGVPEWMVTYGDLMTLLLCFFVLLFIFSKSDVEKYKSAIGSIQQAFGVQTKRPESPYHAYSPSPNESSVRVTSEAESDLFSTIQEIVNEIIENDPDMQQSMRVQTEESGVKITLYNKDLFYPGTAQLKPNASTHLRPVIEAANRHAFNILIRNNSSKSELNTQYFPSVWELSGARAGAALRALSNAGIGPATRMRIRPLGDENSPDDKQAYQEPRTSAMGLGDSAPLYPENDPRRAAQNSRTEFLFYFPGKEVW